MEDALVLFTLAGRCYAARAARIRSLRRQPGALAGSSEQDQVRDLRRWLGLAPTTPGRAIEVDVEGQPIFLLGDNILDLGAQAAVLRPLPALLRGLVDPAVEGVALLEETLALVLDLQALARRPADRNRFVTDGGT